MLTRRSTPFIGKDPVGLGAWLSGAETFVMRRRLLIIAVVAGAGWALFWAIFWIMSFFI